MRGKDENEGVAGWGLSSFLLDLRWGYVPIILLRVSDIMIGNGPKTCNPLNITARPVTFNVLRALALAATWAESSKRTVLQ